MTSFEKVTTAQLKSTLPRRYGALRDAIYHQQMSPYDETSERSTRERRVTRQPTRDGLPATTGYEGGEPHPEDKCLARAHGAMVRLNA